jgi:membrane-associated phospholipid phosphatase
MSLARWVSIAAHPFAVTVVLVGTLELQRGTSAAAQTLAAVALLFVLPISMLMVRQVRRGAWQTVDASHPRDRPLLFAVGGLAVLALLAYLAATRPGSPLLRGGAGTLVMLAVCAAATPWVKVSLHLATAALAAAALLGLGSPVGWLLAALLPVLAWSRVTLGRHRWIEVALGGAIGATAGLAIVRIG